VLPDSRIQPKEMLAQVGIAFALSAIEVNNRPSWNRRSYTMRSLLLSLVLGLGTLGLSLGTPTKARAADHPNVVAAKDTTQVAWHRWGWGYPGYGGFYRGYSPGFYGGYYPRYYGGWYGGYYPRYYGGWYGGGWGGYWGPRYIW
jgi:hypothetical protein